MVEEYKNLVMEHAADIGLKVLGALIFWVVGRWLVHVVVRLVQRSLERQKVDPTVLRYVGSVITVTLNVILVIGILGYFGIQTTTFAALIAAAGVAIGMAWSGLLANFAAGAFLIVLRPFKVGDFVTIGGVTGTVREIGLLTTALDTPDNVFTILGNGKIFRRYDLELQGQRLPARRPRGPACRERRCPHGTAALAGKTGDNPQRAGRAGRGRGDLGIYAGWPSARRATVLSHGPPLAGVLRFLPYGSPSPGCGGLPGTNAGAVGAGATGSVAHSVVAHSVVAHSVMASAR